MIVPGPAGYSCNKVAEAGADIKYQFCLKRCNLILLHEISLLPSRFKFTDLLLWQQVQDELRRTKWSKIMWNRQQSNPANWVSDVRRTDPWKTIQCVFAALSNVSNQRHICWFLQRNGQSETLSFFRIHSQLKAPEFCTLGSWIISWWLA